MVIDDDAAQLLHGIQKVLEAVIPVGGGFVEKNDAALCKSQLQIAGLADVAHEGLGLFQVAGIRVRVVRVTEATNEGGDVFGLEQDVTHGDEGDLRGFGVLDEILPAIDVVVLKGDGGDVFRNEGVHAAESVPGDEGDHVVLERGQIVKSHPSYLRRTAAGCVRVSPRESANLGLLMIFSKDYIGYLARQTTKHLVAAKMIRTDKPALVDERVTAALIEELSLEDRINEEVRVILEAFQADMLKTGASFPEMFKKVKMELTRKYKAVL